MYVHNFSIRVPALSTGIAAVYVKSSFREFGRLTQANQVILIFPQFSCFSLVLIGRERTSDYGHVINIFVLGRQFQGSRANDRRDISVEWVLWR